MLDPDLDLCSPRCLYTSPAPMAIEPEAAHPHQVLATMRDGWQQLEAPVARDVATLGRDLLNEPQVLCDALARFPHTLVHGGPKRQNVGLERDGQQHIVRLDWQLAAHAPPAVDLAWLLSQFAPILPFGIDAAIEHYRAGLARRLGARFSERWWRPQLELGRLGHFLRQACFWLQRIAYRESASVHEQQRTLLTTWTGWVRAGTAWL